MIEIALDRYADIFNKWDPAPFKRREVEPDLENYLARSSDEITFRYPIELYIAVPEGTRDEQIEEELRNGIEKHFTFKIYLLRKDLNKNNTHILGCILAGSLLLAIATILQGTPNKVLPSIFAQGLQIGGWVFLWEAVSLFFFANHELYHRYRTSRRLRNAPIIFGEIGK